MTVLMVPDDGKEFWPTLGAQVCEWIEANLVHGPGDLRGEPARLDDEKTAFIYRMYEVYPRGHTHEGRRRFKRVGLSLPKGLGKTELAAWIAIAELHPSAPVRCVGFDKHGEPIGGPVTDPYIPLVAYTEEQSDELCYGALKAVLEEGGLRDDFDIGLERVIRNSGDGKVVSLSAAPNARDGARTTFSVFDETHWFTLDRLRKAHQVMLANLPKRREADAWALEVTTAPEPGVGSVAEATMDYAHAVRDGRVSDSRLFYFHRQASDEHDLATEKGARDAVVEASGAAATWRDIDTIVALWADPTTDRAYWERVWCNRLVRSSRQAFDAERFKELARDFTPPRRSLITLGFDGAMFRDATALVGTHVETGYQWPVGIWERPPGRKDWQVPVDEVDEAVRAVFKEYRVWRMYADPPYWQSWVAQWAGEFGEDVVVEWWTNRRKAMSYALENYHTAIEEGALSHNSNPTLVHHVANAYKHELPQLDDEGKPLWLIQKERVDSPRKIDAAMAAVLSWEARTDAVAAGKTGRAHTWDPNEAHVLGKLGGEDATSPWDDLGGAV